MQNITNANFTNLIFETARRVYLRRFKWAGPPDEIINDIASELAAEVLPEIRLIEESMNGPVDEVAAREALRLAVGRIKRCLYKRYKRKQIIEHVQ